MPHELLGSLAGANRMSGHRHRSSGLARLRATTTVRPSRPHERPISRLASRPIFESRFDMKIFVFTVLRVFRILMGVRLTPGEASVKIGAFGGILALVHRPPWPFHARLVKHRLC